jgi:hypothetical protein
MVLCNTAMTSSTAVWEIRHLGGPTGSGRCLTPNKLHVPNNRNRHRQEMSQGADDARSARAALIEVAFPPHHAECLARNRPAPKTPPRRSALNKSFGSPRTSCVRTWTQRNTSTSSSASSFSNTLLPVSTGSCQRLLVCQRIASERKNGAAFVAGIGKFHGHAQPITPPSGTAPSGAQTS